MGLFDNVGNLMNLFTSDNTREKETLANRAGVDQSEFSKIASLGLPMILQGINRNTNDEAGNESFNAALKQHEDVDRYSSLEELSANVDKEDGNKILNHIFGNNDNVVNGLSNNLGFSSQSINSVLSVLAPMVMKFFADRKKTQGLNNQDIQRETTNIADQLSGQVSNFTNGNNDLGGILDSFLGGADTNRTSSNRANDNNLGGIVDDFLGDSDANRPASNRVDDDDNDGGIIDAVKDFFK
ncbi:DUF937 domain-containing protein [Fundicoccus sp. Sow4_H7]|uniref:DUF937 domain-containing protein n=1 Tax=Fundicoccus sp. Sow4_H7 TaxID=3438784 RepID=UPI003F939570